MCHHNTLHAAAAAAADDDDDTQSLTEMSTPHSSSLYHLSAPISSHTSSLFSVPAQRQTDRQTEILTMSELSIDINPH